MVAILPDGCCCLKVNVKTKTSSELGHMITDSYMIGPEPEYSVLIGAVIFWHKLSEKYFSRDGKLWQASLCALTLSMSFSWCKYNSREEAQSRNSSNSYDWTMMNVLNYDWWRNYLAQVIIS